MKNFDNVVQELLSMFERQDFPEQVALTIIHRKKGESLLPSDKWSITNRVIMHVIGNTEDARGYKQWQSVGRQVKKGSKAFSIIAPLTKKAHNDETGEDEVVVFGYRSVPVFRLEDTDGAEIATVDYTPEKLPPFLDVAEKIGIKVRWKPAYIGAYGYYRLSDKSITLCSQDYVVYFHELAHAIHDTIEPLSTVPDDKAEVVAELTAAILAEMVGVKGYEVQSYNYIMRYVDGKDSKAMMKAITGVLSLIEQIVNKVIGYSLGN